MLSTEISKEEKTRMGKLARMGRKRGIITAKAPPNTLKSTPLPGTIIKSYYVPFSEFQVKQMIKLGEAATAKYGTTGKLMYKGVPMSRLAVEIIPSITGSVGGMTKDARRAAKHDVARASIDSLKAMLA